MPASDCSQWHEAAEAIVFVWKNGGWALCVSVLVGIAFWRKPWFRDGSKA
jgi:hypothetical protein